MTISIIVAIDLDNAIGADNKLLYWLPNDLKRFKQLTTGNTIIMGRKTYDSLPKGPLPNRRNIVISRNKNLSINGADVFQSLNEAISDCREREMLGYTQSKEIYIIGGASIYKQAFNIAHRLCITLVEAHSDNADTFFPEINPDEWKISSCEEYKIDEKHKYNYKFIDYIRKQQ